MADRVPLVRNLLAGPRRAGGGPVVALLLALFAAGCGGAADQGAEGPAGTPPAAAETSAAGPALTVRDARAVEVPGMAAVYLTVDNPGRAADRLLRVETAAAPRAEIHETVDDGGVMRMRPRPDGFEVPAGGSLALEPGGKHLMLVEPSLPAGGASLALTLHFARAGAIEIEAPVTALAGGPDGHDHAAHGGGR